MGALGTVESRRDALRVFRGTWRDATRSFPWPLTLLVLFFLWLILTVILYELPSYPWEVSSVTQTLSTLTYTAAFVVPVSVLVAVVGASSMLGQLRASRNLDDQALGKRLARLIFWTGTATVEVTLIAAVSIPVASVRLYAGASAATGVAVALSGLVLTGVVVEMALLLTVITEISLRYS